MDVKAIFQGIADKMMVDFRDIQSQITHQGGRGGNWEQTLKEFLVKYLPKRYSIGSGQIIDSIGNVSGQCDIVIYDAFNCPLILVSDNHQIFPVEAVHCVIEVKSVLNATKIREGILSIKKIKQFDREEPIAGFLFAASSVYKGEVEWNINHEHDNTKFKIEAVAETWLRQSKDILPPHMMDGICVLSEGYVEHPKFPPEWGRERMYHGVQAVIDAIPSILLLFFSEILQQLEYRQTLKPFLVRYATRGEIGIVRPLTLERTLDDKES